MVVQQLGRLDDRRHGVLQQLLPEQTGRGGRVDDEINALLQAGSALSPCDDEAGQTLSEVTYSCVLVPILWQVLPDGHVPGDGQLGGPQVGGVLDDLDHTAGRLLHLCQSCCRRHCVPRRYSLGILYSRLCPPAQPGSLWSEGGGDKQRNE